MSILVVADLHLDMWLAEGRDPFADLPGGLLRDLEALIVAGDLSNKPKVRWPRMLAHLARYIAPGRIHVMPGNHDYYDHVLDGDARLAQICAAAGTNFVQQGEIRSGALRVLCCTLWTDFTLSGDVDGAMRAAQARMNDYRHIRLAGQGYRRIRPSDTVQVHAAHRAWLEERLSKPHPGRTLVVSHHAPHPGLLAPGMDELAPAYGSDLSGLMGPAGPDLWFSGHTHHAAETQLGRTRLRNVSLGYPDQVGTGHEARILLRGLIEG
jgi:3',5'-cyclic AMP phosphodiesterase CpdA